MFKLREYFYLTRQETGELIAELWNFFYFKIFFISGLLINGLVWCGALLINSRVSQDLVVLHYNTNFGVDLIGSVKRIYIIPLLGFLIMVINLALAVFIHKYRHNDFFIYCLLGTVVFSNLLLAAALLAIHLINF